MLASILDAIGALSVSVGLITPAVYDYDALPEALDTADLPARLILPLENRDADAGAFSFVAMGRNTGATRRVVDLMLWEPVGQGSFTATNADLVSYVVAYENAHRDNRGLGLSNVWVESITSRVGVYEWPAGSARYFRGVECIVEVHDRVTG